MWVRMSGPIRMHMLAPVFMLARMIMIVIVIAPMLVSMMMVVVVTMIVVSRFHLDLLPGLKI
jgi:hypothetical protein